MAAARPLPTAPLEPDGLPYDRLRTLVSTTLTAGLSVLVRGHPGVGKSTLAAEVAASLDLPLIDLRLAQRDPADLGGVYFPDRERGVLDLFPPGWVQQACEAPALVFLDEINAAVTRLHQAAAYQIVLERRVGPFVFHPGTRVMAAGNLEEDQAIVSPLSTALGNRFVHFTLRVDAACWLRWAGERGLHETVLAYIARHGAEALYANDGDLAFPSPRSWAMAATLMAASPQDATPLVAACVGERAARQLQAFERIFARVPVARIVREGLKMDFRRGASAEPSFVYAAVFAVAAFLRSEGAVADEHLPHVVRFARSPGLDPEYVFLFLRQLKGVAGLLPRLQPLPGFQALASEIVDLHAAAWA
jgi:MoxR-like ATPase